MQHSQINHRNEFDPLEAAVNMDESSVEPGEKGLYRVALFSKGNILINNDISLVANAIS